MANRCHPAGSSLVNSLTSSFPRAVGRTFKHDLCAGLPREVGPNDAPFTLSPRRPGGEGRVRGAVELVCGIAYLTLPVATATRLLPLPPEGRRGALVPVGKFLVERGGGLAIEFE